MYAHVLIKKQITLTAISTLGNSREYGKQWPKLGIPGVYVKREFPPKCAKMEASHFAQYLFSR